MSKIFFGFERRWRSIGRRINQLRRRCTPAQINTQALENFLVQLENFLAGELPGPAGDGLQQVQQPVPQRSTRR